MARRKPLDSNPFLPLSPAVFHVLVALAGADLHGWAIMKEVSRSTDGALHLSPGTLYGLIKRLLRDGLIEESDQRPPSHWDDQRRRYYALTDLGRQVARAEAARMRQALDVVGSSDLLVRPGRA